MDISYFGINEAAKVYRIKILKNHTKTKTLQTRASALKRCVVAFINIDKTKPKYCRLKPTPLKKCVVTSINIGKEQSQNTAG